MCKRQCQQRVCVAVVDPVIPAVKGTDCVRDRCRTLRLHLLRSSRGTRARRVKCRLRDGLVLAVSAWRRREALGRRRESLRRWRVPALRRRRILTLLLLAILTLLLLLAILSLLGRGWRAALAGGLWARRRQGLTIVVTALGLRGRREGHDVRTVSIRR